MELKNSGRILRCKADAWVTAGKRNEDTEYMKGWAAAAAFFGAELSEFLDERDVPQLEPESDSDE